MKYEELIDLDEESKEKFIGSIEKDKTEEVLQEMLNMVSDKSERNVYEDANFFFIICYGNIVEMLAEGDGGPKYSRFPTIITGNTQNEVSALNSIIDKIGCNELSELDDFLREEYWESEYEDSEVIECFKSIIEKSAKDEEIQQFQKNITIFEKLLSQIETQQEYFGSAFEFFKKRCKESEGLINGELYYEWEGMYINLYDNIADCGEDRGRFESYSAEEWIRIIMNLDEYIVTAPV